MFKKVAISAIALLLFSGALQAQDYDGSKPLVCFTKHAFSCAAGELCVLSDGEDVNLPEFFRIDFASKTVHAKRPDGESVTSTIGNVEVNDGELVLHGTESGRGWTAAITQGSGKLAVSAVGDQVAFVLFGVCSSI